MTPFRSVINIVFMLCLTCLAACTQPVPGGSVGMVRSASGFDGKILNPGNHNCSGRDVMYLLEVSDNTQAVEINQLTVDRINFKATITVLYSVNRKNEKAVADAFSNITPAVGTTITSKQLFDTYIRPITDQEARKVYSKFQSTEVVSNRAKIVAEVQAAVSSAFTDGLIEIKQVTVNNDDFPAEVTKAWEARASQYVAIETEKAIQERALIAKKNELSLAEMDYKIELVNAANIADANKIIGSSITPEYLAWWQLKVLGEAAKGPNNWGFIPYTDYVNAKTSGEPVSRLSKDGLVDAELLARIQAARQIGQTGATPAPTPVPSPEKPPAPVTTPPTPVRPVPAANK